MEQPELPLVDDPSQVVGRASYHFTEDEFLTACRAARLATMVLYRSRVWGVVFFGFWHLLAVGALFQIVAWARGTEGLFGPMEPGPPVAPFMVGFVSLWLLWVCLYGLNRRLRRAFRPFPLADAEYATAFTPDRYITHTPLLDSSDAWLRLQQIVELRDGFVLQPQEFRGGIWLPDHALQAPFDHATAAAFFRTRAPQYRVLNRWADRKRPVQPTAPALAADVNKEREESENRRK